MEHYHETEETNKYNNALELYPIELTDEQVKSRTAQIIEKYVAENNTEAVKKLLFNCIDLTTLKTEDSEESVLKFTERVNELDNEYPDLKNVAAICVYPNFAKIVSQSLEVEEVNIACVSGCFHFYTGFRIRLIVNVNIKSIQINFYVLGNNRNNIIFDFFHYFRGTTGTVGHQNQL